MFCFYTLWNAVKDYIIGTLAPNVTAQKLKFSIDDFLSKCDQLWRKLRIWSHLLKKFSIENFIFCAVCVKLPDIIFEAFQNDLNNSIVFILFLFCFCFVFVLFFCYTISVEAQIRHSRRNSCPYVFNTLAFLTNIKKSIKAHSYGKSSSFPCELL